MSQSASKRRAFHQKTWFSMVVRSKARDKRIYGRRCLVCRPRLRRSSESDSDKND